LSFSLERLTIRSPIKIVALIALSWSLLACAQTNTTELNQYKRAEWGLEQGLSPGRIQALAQTRDGYLWIGTAEGLLRFDGIRFVPILTDQKQPLRHILGLTVDKDGILWVRAADTRIRQVQRDSISPPVSIGSRLLAIVTMAAAQTTGIYATDLHKSVFRLIQNRVEALPIRSQALLISISEADDRRLWIGTDRGLLSWTAGSLRAEASPDVDKKINCLLPDVDGHVWVGTDDGLSYWDGHQLIRRSFSNPDMRHLQILTIMEDRDKNLWIGTSRGLLRFNSVGAEWVPTGPNADRTPVTAVVQDREGDIWFGVGSTLERLESTPIVPVRLSDTTSGGSFGPLYVDQHGRVWFADVQHGLYWMEHGVVHAVLNDGLSKDEVYSIDGEGDDIWVGRRSGGLTKLSFNHGTLESKTWATRNGLSQNSAYVVRVASKESVWIGTLTGGLNLFADGHFTHFEEKDGLPANDISAIELGNQGQVWIGTSGGVCKIENHRCSPLSPGRQTAAKDVLSLLEDASRGLWIGTSKGLFLADEHGQRPISLGTGSRSRILGLGLDGAGRLWIVSDHAVMSAMPAELLASKDPSIRTYGNDDGLQSNEGVHRSRSVVTDGKGQVWITTTHELAMIGTKPIPLPTVIPHVEEVNADGAILDRNNAEVAPSAKRLRFSFTGLDLHAPSRVRFRYRLDDFDKTWSDVVHDREATYTNLAPGKYTFRLIASNESNSWNSEESTVHVVIEPEIWQRWSVRSILIAVLVLFAGFAYHVRTRSLLAQANVLADERLGERTRIARDIHDTLLQGFISSLMHLHVAEKQIASDSPLKERFAFILENMERVIEEARLAVVGLRTPDSGPGIESSLRDFFQEIADLGEARIVLRSTGRPRHLKAKACEQICSIAKEAILNAVRHASAQNVHVTISWGWLRLRVSVSDDGCGIDALTLEHGRAQHWGLVGMRERAKRLKGRLMIVSRMDEGTRVSLSVPATIAYRGLRESKDSADVA
jgi:ligand-binding sensor domain-containing protein/signal transduction histidine kinase